MGIRRRRRKLTTLMSRLDQRVKSVELRPISLLTEAEVSAAVEVGDGSGQPPTAVIGIDAPRFIRVQDAYIYPKRINGANEDRVEIYMEADLELEVGDTIHVSGIHGTSNFEIDASSESFIVKFVDTPPWTDRNLPGNKVKDDPTGDQLPGVTITNTYSFKPDTVAPTTWNNYYRLQTKRLVDTYAISGSTVTLTMNATHRFKAGDIVFVDIFSEDSRAYGIDGLFRIDSVTSNTIVYTLDAGGVDDPVPATAPENPVYVFPVAKKFLAVGSTWADSANNKIYYWDGLRWVDYSTVTSPVQDGDPPAAPTDLEITSEGRASTNLALPTASVTLSWTAPTLTKEGEELTDLAGYIFGWRRSPTEQWQETTVIDPTITSYTFDGSVLFSQNTLYYFQVFAIDSGLQRSEPVSGSHTTAVKTSPLESTRPTAPSVESKLGTITVLWDGFMATTPPSLPPFDVQYIQIHRSTINDFTPSDSTLVTTISAASGNYATFADLDYNTTYYFKLVLVDTSGVRSLPSLQATSQVTPLVDTDLLVGNVLNNWAFNGNLISAGALADGSLNASTLFGPNVIVQDAIAANAIGANEIAAGAIIAGKIGANAITANTIAANSIYAGAIQANAIKADKIDVGALDGKLITGSTIRTSANVARVELNNTGIYAYNTSGAITFRVLSNTGAVFIGSGVQIGGYATTADLGTVSSTANTAKTTADSKVAPSEVANAINNNTTTINGAKITTGTIDADKLTANMVLATNIKLQGNNGRIEIRGAGNNAGIVGFIHPTGEGIANASFRLYTGNGLAFLKDTYIDGDITIKNGGDISLSGTGKITAGSTIISSGLISGGTVQGATIRTRNAGSTDQRVIMDSTGVSFYASGNSDSSPRGSILGTTRGITLSGGQISFEPTVDSQVAFVSSSGIGFNGIDKRWIGSLIATGGLQAGSGNVVLSSNGNIAADGSISGVGLSSSSGLSVSSGGASITGSISSSFNITAGNRFNQSAFTALSGTTVAVHRVGTSGFFTPSGSDERLKDNIEDLGECLDLINKLRPVSYTYRSEAESPITNYGLIAQEVRPLFDENTNIVNGQETDEEFLSIEYIQLIAPLIKAVQELSAKNSALEVRILELEKGSDVGS